SPIATDNGVIRPHYRLAIGRMKGRWWRRVESSRRGVSVPALLAMLVVFVVLMAVMARARSQAGSTPMASRAASRSDDRRLDPEPYRKWIAPLEELLYKPARPGYGGAEMVSRRLMDLSAAVRGNGSNPRRSQAARELFDLAGRADPGDAGYAVPDV